MLKHIGSLVLAAAAVGCGAAGAASAPSALPIIAIDTSASAVESHEAYFRRAANQIQSIPDGEKLYLYRFDSSPAEVYSETPPAAFDEIGVELKRVLSHRSGTKGTNLGKLFTVIDRRMDALDTPVRVSIYTDCGIEAMTKADIDQVKSISTKWNRDPHFEGIEFIGVRDSYREPLREMLKFSEYKLEILR